MRMKMIQDWWCRVDENGRRKRNDMDLIKLNWKKLENRQVEYLNVKMILVEIINMIRNCVWMDVAVAEVATAVSSATYTYSYETKDKIHVFFFIVHDLY